jgi:hypothetical protein
MFACEHYLRPLTQPQGFLLLETVATSTEVCLSSREELCLIELQWERPVAANDGEFWPRDVDRRPSQRAHIVWGLLFVVALAIIATFVLRVEGWGKASAAKDVDAARVVGMHPCLAGLRQSGWRHSDQFEALCAR